MPPRAFQRPRTWGTRFDSLTSASPPLTPPKHPISHHPSTPSFGHSFTPGNAPSPDVRKRDDKMPHDASVFVGSLPSNIDHQELTRLLSEHLSAHAEVKSIKVVRDTKGGVCAFVQCEDAASATRLIDILRSQPSQPFMGRYLRYEPARALRTLLISYRTPVRSTDSRSPTVSNGQNEAIIELEPANAMRLYRPHGQKYINILYNDEACNFDTSIVQTPSLASNVDVGAAHTSLDGSGLLLSPLTYDSDTIYKLVSAFGPVEYFGSHEPDQLRPTIEELCMYPAPHDASRSSIMDPGCWEIKWQHRDDCVSALMALRAVPHLTVTWAHSPHSRSSFNTPLYNQRLRDSTHTTTPYRGHRFPEPRQVGPYRPRAFTAGALLPLHIREPTVLTHGSEAEFETVTGATDNPLLSRVSLSLHANSVNPSAASSDGVRSAGEAEPVVRTQSRQHRPRQPSSPGSPTAHRGQGAGVARSLLLPLHPNVFVKRNDDRSNLVDQHEQGHKVQMGGFSPLRRQEPQGETWKSSSWSARRAGAHSDDDDGRSSEGDVVFPTLSAQVAPTKVRIADLSSPRKMQGVQVNTVSTPSIRHNTIDGGSTTPESAQSLISPDTPGFMLPPTPDSGSDGGDPAVQGSCSHTDDGATEEGTSEQFQNLNFDKTVRDLDPTTIFVGGLEMDGPYAWDENKVMSVFGKYGEVVDVKVVKPVNKRSAFAFVKFSDMDAPAQAVAQEHNGMHNGRQIRVQLRNSNPHQRSPWKFAGRGRGKGFPHRFPMERPDFNFTNGGMEGHQPLNIDGMHQDQSSHTMSGYHGGMPSGATSSSSAVSSSYGGNIEPSSYVPSNAHTPDSSTVPPHVSGHLPSGIDSAPLSTAFGPCIPSAPEMTAPVMAYPAMSGVGYYPPQPWYPHPYQYPLHVAPGYHPRFSVPVPQTTHSGIENGAPITTMSGVYHPFAHYPQYPVVIQEPVKDSHPAQPDMQPSQPPLLPTGFIQGEEGLVPLYPREALDQYMNSSSSQNQPVPPRTRQEGMRRSIAMPVGAWGHFPYPPPFYPNQGYGTPATARGQSLPSPGTTPYGPSWFHNPAFAMPHAGLVHPPAYPSIQPAPGAAPAGFGSPYQPHGPQASTSGSTVWENSPSPMKRYPRRDRTAFPGQMAQHNSGNFAYFHFRNVYARNSPGSSSRPVHAGGVVSMNNIVDYSGVVDGESQPEGITHRGVKASASAPAHFKHGSGGRPSIDHPSSGSQYQAGHGVQS